jgi:hypothetical protein
VQWIAHYFEGLDERGRRFVVRPCVGSAAAVVAGYGVEELIRWRPEWGRYRPQSTDTADRLVAEFLRRRRGHPDRVNGELQQLAREPVPVRPPQPDAHERQLPAGDRA